ncbi:putative drug exporter of the RND superfamily [Gracilibacillus ureilyticus]|uniref:Putative drug exporter of the RND superfamily n=1 Tax=Gracilibacillus ureilyticus TaxID=531814 RepID=A0A1H9QMU5_9BACI|nr:MMPL family transporter [Gracilibacillus ureilyticus]SER61911.1 putative drug exporter of the RND superfamily [Gracilibacillus ureilyticus]
MHKFKNWRSISFLLWIAISVIMLTTMPNMNQLVQEKGQITIPDTAQSSVANEMIIDMHEDGGESYGIIAVFHSRSEAALTEKQRGEIADTINKLLEQQEELGITEILTHLDSEKMEEQLVSEDGTTILAQISVNQNVGEIDEVADSLNKVIDTNGVETYLTGSELVSNDFANSTQDGVKKTEIIAVIFILVVLIIVFRSPIVPIISLLTVGVSYLVSMGVIAQIVDKFDFPFSNFTQVFVVVVLFGVGTDYNILLYTRFKEELSRQNSAYHAAKVTFKSAGKTVLYSGLAVLIGFSSLILANFSLYQATSGVAIGVAVLLLVLTTLNPFFMVLLGKKMFYPIRNFKGHGESRLWGFLAKNTILRPFLAVILVLVITVPFIFKYTGTLNFNDLFEVNDKYESKQGINVIEEHFPPGFSSPGTLVIKSDDKLNQAKAMQTIDELTEKIAKLDGVAEVYSATRPTGDKIDELYIDKQANELGSGIDDANNGIGEVNNGLSSAQDQMSSNKTEDLANVQKLIDGTNELETGVVSLGEAIAQLTEGFNGGVTGAESLETGLSTVHDNVEKLSGATSQLLDAYSQLETGLNNYSEYFDSMAQAIDGAISGYNQIELLMSGFVEANPDMANDESIQQTIGIAISAQEQLSELAEQLEQLSIQHQTVMASFAEANGSLSVLNDGLIQLQTGVEELETGATELKEGLSKGAEGSGQIVGKTGELQAGLTQINDGQTQLLTGLSSLQDKMAELQTGLVASTDGLAEISDGLNDAESYLNDLSESNSSEKFYIPKEVLEGEEFQESLDTYMSDDRTITTLRIILDVNPYSREAMPIVANINNLVETQLEGTELADAEVAIAGTTATNADLKEITEQDFLRTATIMLIGITLVLMLITWSVSHSLFIIGSLVLVYFTSLGISELISTHLLGVDMLSWNVPFFSFIMIIALGVDYSIFLMMRYNETDGDPSTKILEASRHIGGVVLSAALILGGTFAALIPSGVLTLIQVAAVVITGLVLLSIAAMPILLPGLMEVTNKLKLFRKKK